MNLTPDQATKLAVAEIDSRNDGRLARKLRKEGKTASAQASDRRVALRIERAVKP